MKAHNTTSDKTRAKNSLLLLEVFEQALYGAVFGLHSTD